MKFNPATAEITLTAGQVSGLLYCIGRSGSDLGDDKWWAPVRKQLEDALTQFGGPKLPLGGPFANTVWAPKPAGWDVV